MRNVHIGWDPVGMTKIKTQSKPKLQLNKVNYTGKLDSEFKLNIISDYEVAPVWQSSNEDIVKVDQDGMLVEGGNSTLINCTVYETHSGITIKSGELNIDGGTYDGYSHGGVYLGNGNCNSYIRNAKIQEVDLRGEGMYDDGVAGTNHAGMYVGGASYMKIYMDNCEIYGLQQPIVLKFSSSSSHSNCLYVSNSSINLDYTNYGVRNDGSNEIVFGKGNNFNEDNLRYKRNYTHTEDEY